MSDTLDQTEIPSLLSYGYWFSLKKMVEMMNGLGVKNKEFVRVDCIFEKDDTHTFVKRVIHSDVDGLNFSSQPRVNGMDNVHRGNGYIYYGNLTKEVDRLKKLEVLRIGWLNYTVYTPRSTLASTLSHLEIVSWDIDVKPISRLVHLGGFLRNSSKLKFFLLETEASIPVPSLVKL